MIGTAVSIATTILSLTAFAILISNKVESEWFQTYKAPLFLGSAFLVFAILGLPYMSYDSALHAPTMQFMAIGFTIAFLLGALLVYTTNLTYETYIMAISSIAILATVFGRIGPTETSPAVQFHLYLVMTAAILYGTSKGLNYLKLPAELQSFITFYQGAVPIVLWGLVAVGLFKGIRSLAEMLAKQPGYTGAGYEAFQTSLTQESRTPLSVTSQTSRSLQSPILSQKDLGQTPSELLKQTRDAMDRIQESIEEMLGVADTTCAIIRDIEQGYVGSLSGPDNEAEYDLPLEEQDKRRVARQQAATKMFSKVRHINASIRNPNLPMLECFQDPVEEELRAASQELQQLLEHSEVLAQIQTAQKVQIALDFANVYLNRAEAEAEGFQSFDISKLNGPAFLTAVKQLLLRELEFTHTVNTSKAYSEQTNQRINKGIQKANMVEQGNYTPTQSAVETAKVPCTGSIVCP